VKILTDKGIHGVGESTLEYRELTVQQAVHELSRSLIGKDPHNVEELWLKGYRDAYWRGGPVLMSALSGVEMALWDIKGKDLGVPVYQLLGGKVRDTIDCYANGWFAGANAPEEFVQKTRTAVDAGFRGLKFDPFGKAWMNISKKELQCALTRIKGVIDTAGSDVEILIEGHGRFNVPTAVRIGQALEDFDITWFEEPIPPDDMEGMQEVKRRIRVPLAGGERLYSRWDYNEYIRRRLVDFIQPDVSHCGGIGELKKIATMAESTHTNLCPHNPSGPVANAATLQLAACIPNFLILETMATDVPYRREITNENVLFSQGTMAIPDAPGLGIDINEEVIKKYPYKPVDLRHYTGSLTDIRPADASEYFSKG